MNWYDRIKELIRNELLPLELELRLREAGFPVDDGKYSRSAYIWEQNFQKLKEYMVKHKQTRAYVPQHKDRNHPDYELGGWFARQKLRRKKKITPYFLEGEFEKLQSVGFVWETMNAGERACVRACGQPDIKLYKQYKCKAGSLALAMKLVQNTSAGAPLLGDTYEYAR